MRNIGLILSLLALSVSGQTFSFISDSVQPFIASHGTTAKIVNKTNSIVTIDSIFFIFLPQPIEPPSASPKLNQLRFGISSVDTPKYGGGYAFYDSWQKTDSLYIARSYYNTGVIPITIKPKDTMLLQSFQGFAPSGELRPNDTNRYVLIIFKSGTTFDTLTLMGHSAGYVNTISNGRKAPGKTALNTLAPSETYTILGQRVAPAALSRKSQVRIIKNGSAIRCSF